MPILHDDKAPDDSSFALRWYKVRNRIKEEFGQRPDVNVMLFLIGLNETGIVKEVWEKEEKLDLMHIAVCKLLSAEGYYKFTGIDDDGWHHYDAVKGIPTLNMKEQEELLKKKIVEYFEAL